MRNIHKIILAFSVSSLTLGACTDSFLDTEPITDLTESNFYRTPDDAYKALVGCYDGLQIIWADGVSFPVASEILSDNAFGGTGASDGFGYQMLDEFDKNRSPADQDLFGANWDAYYRAVYRCNVLIGKIDQINWTGNEALRKTYEAEARYLRAFLYFDMVRLWGNIPLLTEPSSGNVPQASPEEVYKVIAQDLKFAADNLPATSYAAQQANTRGRVTKWAAQALIGRVYLYYTGYYGKPDLAGVVTQAQALAYLEDVVSKSGHGLVEDFASLWPASLAKYAGEDNKETVFAIKYTYTSDYNGNTDGNHWLVMLGMREQYSFPYGNGWGGATVNPELWQAYSANDTRRGASIISIAEEKIKFVNQSKQREYTGYYNKKYTPLVDETGKSIAVSFGATNFMIGQFQDYTAIRYADVLLMAAELGSPNAQAYFDQVRRRAYKDKFTSLAVSKSSLLQERYLEFAYEGIRYWDLLRQGVEVAASAIAETTTVLNGGATATKTISAAKITQTRGLQQIPYTQITLSNGVLKQNAGW
ncbi:RagB/SusD family nutrient uptake outer membrane protein [Rufibacter glacialis]|uniref:RagB/SusD family nutrient uptake outer membrane protein n=1 Tax=Rufibacter glacialis TaxID=1259555 RepID=A0A5M8QKU6_9BACT|nr:RagB/SusD family nutrient uptake outer membrane protein [Rufibacter glacialis]KAA6435604.1 RagB/SusD family nutrient uptake outer membrane protein [Rufibacter glacialis]GGK64906.1 membrane protein [Rufibacter glacialis]